MCSTVILVNENTYMIKFPLSINSRTKKSKNCIKHRDAYSSNRDGIWKAFLDAPLYLVQCYFPTFFFSICIALLDYQ